MSLRLLSKIPAQVWCRWTQCQNPNSCHRDLILHCVLFLLALKIRQGKVMLPSGGVISFPTFRREKVGDLSRLQESLRKSWWALTGLWSKTGLEPRRVSLSLSCKRQWYHSFSIALLLEDSERERDTHYKMSSQDLKLEDVKFIHHHIVAHLMNNYTLGS